jgi:hypothetical protein
LTVILGRALRLRPVIPVTLATVQFSRSAKRRSTTHAGMGLDPHATGIAPVSQNSTACEPPHLDAEVQSCGLPDPVDMSSGRSRSGERRGARELRATIRRRSVPSG